MKITYKQLLGINEGLAELASMQGVKDFKLKVRIVRNLSKISQEIEIYNKLRQGLITELAFKDDKGQIIQLPNNNIKVDPLLFEKRSSELLATEIDVDLEKISETDLSEEAQEAIEARTLFLLDPIFEYKE